MHDGVVGSMTVNGVTLLTLAGELDVAAASTLHRELTRTVSATRPDLALDLRQVDFLDCAGVGVIVAAYNQVKANGGCLRLIGADRRALRIFHLCKLENVLCVHDSVEAATAVTCSRHT
jgi:anti-sigma B factor antagonist